MNKKLILPSLALTVGFLSAALSSIISIKLLSIILAILAIGFVVIKVSSERLIFITTCLLPLVYIPLAFTGGIYISLTYVIVILSAALYLKYKTVLPKGGRLEKILLVLAIIITMRLLIIGLLEGTSFNSIFGMLSADIAKIVSGIIFIRITQIKSLRQEIFNGLLFATILILGMHLYQVVVGLNYLLAQGYTTPHFNYNTASGKMRPFSTFLTPVTYGAYLATMCGFLFWYIPEKHKFLKSCVFISGLVALIGTGTRSAWIAFVVGMAIVVLIQKKKNWSKIIILGMPLIATVFLAFLIKPELFDSITNRLSTVTDLEFSSNAIRLELWKGTIHAMIEGNWMIGYGTKSFVEVVSPYIPFRIDSFSHPHQTFLEILFRYGVLGFLAFISLFVVAIQNGIKGVRQESDSSHYSASLAAIIIFTVSSFFETTWGSYNVFLSLFLLMGFGADEEKVGIQKQSSREKLKQAMKTITPKNENTQRPLMKG